MTNIFNLLWPILNSATRRKLPWSIAFSFVVAGLETLGIGLLLPLFQNLTSSENTINTFLKLNLIEIPNSENNSSLYLAFLIVIIFFVKNVLGYLIAAWNINFSLSVRSDLSIKLYKHYIHAPYDWHISKSSSTVIRNIGMLGTVFGSVLQPLLNIVVDIIFIFGIASLLLWTNPVLTLLSLIVMGFAMSLYYFFSRRKLNIASKKIIGRTKETIRNIQEALSAVKEIKIYGRESFIEKKFNEHTKHLMSASGIVTKIQILPKYYLETIFVFLALALTYFASLSLDKDLIFPQLALFGVASVRLLPSLNRILSAVAAIKSGIPALKIISFDVQNLPKMVHDLDASKIINSLKIKKKNTGIQFENVSFSYPNVADKTLSNINMEISWGRMIGVVGKTGAGKSTLIDLMTGLLSPTTGKILIDGLGVQEYKKSGKGCIGYVPQEVFLLDDTIASNIAFGVPYQKIDKNRVNEVIEMVALLDVVKILEDGIETVVGERGVRFSGGQRQRIGIARALYHDPQILILDEATSALDSETETTIKTLFNRIRKNKILVFIAHRLSSIKDCDEIIFIKSGKIDSTAPFVELARTNDDFRRMVEISNIWL